MAAPLLSDSTWLQQGRYAEAECLYQQILAGTRSGQPATSGGGGGKQQPQQKQQPQNPSGKAAPAAAAGDAQIAQRIKSLEDENNNLKQASQDLTALVKKLEARVSALEKSNSGSSPAKASEPAKPAAPAAAEESDDDDFFGSGSDDESESEDEATKAALAAYHAKKSKKPAVIAKSSLLIDVKPWDDETDMAELEKCVRTIEMDGLLWGASKLIPVGYGIKKLQINAVIEDDKVSTDEMEERICGFEDFVQSMDIAAFNKI